MHRLRLQREWHRNDHRRTEKVPPESDWWDVEGPEVMRMFNNSWRKFLIIKVLTSRFIHNDWTVSFRELDTATIKLVSQKGSYASSEMYRSIQILLWSRHGIHREFLAHVIIGVVLCRAGIYDAVCVLCVCLACWLFF